MRAVIRRRKSAAARRSTPNTDCGRSRIQGRVAIWLGDEDLQDKRLREQVTGQELVVGSDDELAGHLADRISFSEHGRVPILSRATGQLAGLVARRDLLRVRTNMMRHEHEREALIKVLPLRRGQPGL